MGWNPYLSYRILFFVYLICVLYTFFLLPTSSESNGILDCDLWIRSSAENKSGTFHSINYPSYPHDTTCSYYFVALSNERVEIVFKEFDVIGVPPRCLHDFVDIYTQLKKEHDNPHEISLQGRYCGKDREALPALIRSVYNIVLIIFSSDGATNGEGFVLDYRFIPDDKAHTENKLNQHLCGYNIDDKTLGNIQSPTYPGIYPDYINCFYKITGKPGQRIKLSFNEVDLYGGKDCSFDFIEVYDGSTNQDIILDKFCGTMNKPYEIFSTGHQMLVQFETHSGRGAIVQDATLQEPTQLRGFNATYHISNHYVDLSKIRQGTHVRGTECDRLIKSEGETNGTFTSPYYPSAFPPNVTCRYFFDGLTDNRDLEKVIIHLSDFQIGEYLPPQSQDFLFACSSGFLRGYTSKKTLRMLMEQELVVDPVAPDFEFCGDKWNKDKINADNPKLYLEFDTHSAKPGRGFKANYYFTTDYAIPGTPTSLEARCQFVYNSVSAIQGTFNSPRHPSYYPNNTYCIYDFKGGPDEVVRITFENFQIEEDENCTKDYVAILVPSQRPRKSGRDEREVVTVGRYCGDKLPGPQDEGSREMRVNLHTDNDQVRKGFRAKYEFVKKEPSSKKCFMNETRGGAGIILSPNYPHKYTTNVTCEWMVWGTYKTSKILLNFDIFSIEGNPKAKIGCGNAVLKIYLNREGVATKELCGENNDQIHQPMISQTNFLRIKFVSTAKATGGKGFALTWTELLHKDESRCPGFRCRNTGYCISHSLRCNGVPNCGKQDSSDEKDCKTYTESSALNIVLCALAVFTMILLLLALAWWLYRRRIRNEVKVVEVKFMTKPPTKGNKKPPLKEKVQKISLV